ncbi:unnamed protein product [Peniophora sp. CBMAI 1063]|nr:unnamed protein product [Peniophora sp. CBMAI 1063]
MSDVDLDDELLALAGDEEHKESKKRKSAKQGSSSKMKRRRAEDESDEESPAGNKETGPSWQEMLAAYERKYPLEGLYVDDEERDRLLQMTEFEREDILTQRRDEKQKIDDKRQLESILATRGGPKDSVSQAAKREHGIRGATKEKTKQLENLRAKRTERAEKRARGGSPGRDRSSSPMEMETDEEDEDGQIGRDEQDDERLRRLSGGYTKSSKDEPIEKEDLNRIQLTRDRIAKYYLAPWFKDYVKGMWVRYLIGNEDGRPVYRACEVLSLSDEKVKPYPVNDVMVDQEFELRHGQACKFWPMDKTSNAEFTDREFDRIVKVCKADGIPFPGKDACEKKLKEMDAFYQKRHTEKDVDAILQRKRDLSGGLTIQEERIRRAELQQARNHAVKYGDHAEVQRVDEQLAALGVNAQPTTPAPADDPAARWAKVNERNRKANLEAVRKIEHAEAERKRKEREQRRLAAASRTATPLPPGTPDTSIAKPVSDSKGKDFEASVLESIEIDLGDF